MGKKRNNLFKKIALGSFTFYLLFGVSLYVFQEDFLFRGDPIKSGFQFDFKIPFKEVFLQPNEETSLHAIYFKVKNPKGVILYFHGNTGNVIKWGNIAQNLTDYNYNVLVMDYRGYGKSFGKRTEELLYQDAQSFYDFANKEFTSNQIVIYGRSLGTGIATQLATKNDSKILLLETPYSSITDIGQIRFPIYPVKYVLNYTFNSIDRINNVATPIVIFHGTADWVVPFSSGKKLSNAISKPHQFFSITGANHNNISQYEVYKNTLDSLFNQ